MALSINNRRFNPTHDTRHYPLGSYESPDINDQARLRAIRFTKHLPTHPDTRSLPVIAHPTHTLASPVGGYAARLATRTRAHCHAPPRPFLLPSHFGETRLLSRFIR